MEINIFNFDSFQQLETLFTKEEFCEYLVRAFSDYQNEVNLVFIGLEDIKELNQKYLNKNWATDVLAFSSSINDFVGEVYISPEYLEEKDRFDLEEILRMSIHGILHLLGYEHEGYFTEDSEEEMFAKQEELLQRALKV